MLIPNAPKANEVVAIRLVSGEEVIGKLLEEDNETITLGKPIAIQMRMISQNEAGMQFAPFMSAVDETMKHIFYKASLVMTPMKPRPDVASAYTKATSSLAVPTPSSLIKPV